MKMYSNGAHLAHTHTQNANNPHLLRTFKSTLSALFTILPHQGQTERANTNVTVQIENLIITEMCLC